VLPGSLPLLPSVDLDPHPAAVSASMREHNNRNAFFLICHYPFVITKFTLIGVNFILAGA
jgi:hypothetical protein